MEECKEVICIPRIEKTAFPSFAKKRVQVWISGFQMMGMVQTQNVNVLTVLFEDADSVGTTEKRQNIKNKLPIP
jgi:hypothetical protein